MKTILCLSTVLILSGCQYLSDEPGGYFNTNTKTLTPVASRIRTIGSDLRIYEFTPLSNPRKTCVFVAGSRKGGLVCFDKP